VHFEHVVTGEHLTWRSIRVCFPEILALSPRYEIVGAVPTCQDDVIGAPTHGTSVHYNFRGLQNLKPDKASVSFNKTSSSAEAFGKSVFVARCYWNAIRNNDHLYLYLVL